MMDVRKHGYDAASVVAGIIGLAFAAVAFTELFEAFQFVFPVLLGLEPQVAPPTMSDLMVGMGCCLVSFPFTGFSHHWVQTMNRMRKH